MNTKPSLQHFLFFIAICFLIFFNCTQKEKKKKIVNLEKLDRSPLVVCTTSQVGDILTNLTKGTVDLKVMFGPATDPHSFYPKPSDTQLLKQADLIFFNGLNLEDKLAEILEHNLSYKSYAASLAVSTNRLIVVSANDRGVLYDPHIWFDILIWQEVARYFAGILIQYLPSQQDFYLQNLKIYLEKLNDLEIKNKSLLTQIPPQKRILLTTHDAFSYFARFNGFSTKSLLGITTYGEASIKTINEIQQFILDNDVTILFAEYGVRDKGLLLLQKSLAAKGKIIAISEKKLYSDAMGSAFPENTYRGMYEYNVKTLLEILRK